MALITRSVPNRDYFDALLLAGSSWPTSYDDLRAVPEIVYAYVLAIRVEQRRLRDADRRLAEANP